MGRPPTAKYSSSTNLQNYTMKVLVAILPLLGLATATLEATCEECTAVVTTLAKGLTSSDSVEEQVRILLAEVCPQSENPDDCVEKLPDFWGRLAAVLWPGYYDPSADWMCGPICMEQSLREVTCEECTSGIQASIDQLVSEEFVSGIVDALSGDGFCGMEEDPDPCSQVIPVFIPLALPALAAEFDPARGVEACNTALPGTCPE